MDWVYVVFPSLAALLFIFIAGLCIWHLLRLRRFDLRRPIARFVLLTLIAAACLGMAALSGWNAYRAHRFRSMMPGRLVQVDGHAMRIECMGSGSPTIVLDAGLGNDGLIWGGIQPALARSTRVCSYDRAGFGWSDPVPGPQDADHIAAELHGLLAAAGISKPVVLMAHSIAGIYARDYASRYPADVAGLILVDSSTPWQNRDPAFAALEKKHSLPHLRSFGNEALMSLGVARMLGGCTLSDQGIDAHAAGFTDHAAELAGEDGCHEGFSAEEAELDNFDPSGRETVNTGHYGDLPVLIFSHDPATAAGEPERHDVEMAWARMQQDLKKLSTRSRQIIAKGSGHYVQIQRPDLIRREVPLFLDQIRGVVPKPSDYGSTRTE